MTVRRPSFPPFLLLSFQLLAALHTTSDAAVSSHRPAIQCSRSGSYTSASAYAANLNQFLASLPEKTVSKNGGFFNGTVGEGMDTVHGLAMCSAEYSRSDCGDCLAAAANSASGLLNRCPGSTTVVAWFDPCLVRYSDTKFFATTESGVIYAWQSAQTVRATVQYSDDWANNLHDSVFAAMASPQRFGTSSTDPYMLVQCTWDLPPNLCMQCMQELTANSPLSPEELPVEGKLGSYSCALRYSKTSFPVVPFVGGPTPQYVDQAARSATQSSGASKGSVAIVVVGSVIGVIVLACLLTPFIRYVLKLRSKHKRGHVREFTFQELASATRNFAEIQKLGEGAFGAVYKGIVTLQDNEGNKKEVYAAIKKNKHTKSDEAKAAFYKEIDIMSPLNHCNIIRLMGWCNEKKNLLLVYELAEDLNLQDRLYGGGASVDAERFGVRASGSVLDWHKRYNILVGIASGLEYLHTKCEKSVLHRDIKPGNVMLDKNFNAKLCDFGLVTQLTHAITSRSTDVIIGTQAYMDPTYRRNGKIYKESDVYSFGVLLLEVVCGEEPNLIDNAGKNSLIEKVRECENRGAILEAADQRLRGEFDEEIKGALSVGLWCVKESRGDRPTIQIMLSQLTTMVAMHVEM